MTIGTIPSQHTAHTLLGTIAWLKADPANRMVRVRVWPEQDFTLDTFMDWFRARMNKKITDKMHPHEPRPPYRKLADSWWWQIRRLADAVNTPQLRVYEQNVPKEFRQRLVHRLVRIGEE